jgi:lipopolysaccharide biosynthesis glycosyltransferase
LYILTSFFYISSDELATLLYGGTGFWDDSVTDASMLNEGDKKIVQHYTKEERPIMSNKQAREEQVLTFEEMSQYFYMLNEGDMKNLQHDTKEESPIMSNKRAREERVLTLEEVSKYFYMPIIQAAKELNVGLTLLKKKCRELGIPRWPHRKMKSMQSLIKNIQVINHAQFIIFS